MFDRPYLAYCGQIGFINGLQFLIPMAEYLKANSRNMKIIIVGDGAERQHLEAHAKELQLLNDRIFFAGKLSKEKTLSIMKHAAFNICSFKSIKEMEKNSSNKFFDSLSVGTPILMNYRGWQYDLVKFHRCGHYFDPSNFRSSLQDIIELIEEELKLGEMQDNAHKLGVQLFARDDHYQTLLTTMKLTLHNDKAALNDLASQTYKRYILES